MAKRNKVIPRTRQLKGEREFGIPNSNSTEFLREAETSEYMTMVKFT